MDFETVQRYLEKLGCLAYQATEYRGKPGEGRHEVDLPKIHSLNPNISALEWMHLTSQPGADYVGGCCGQMSSVQDILCHWYRHNPFSIPLGELVEVAETMIAHDGSDGEDNFTRPPWEWPEFAGEAWANWDEAVEGLATLWKDLRPWLKLEVLYQLTKDHWVPKPPSSITHREPIDQALRQLENCSVVLGLHNFFVGPEETGEWSSQAKAQRAQMLAKLTPALKTLNSRLQELDLGGFEGWALIDLEDGDEDAICSNGYGLCLYATEGEVQHILDLWKKDNEMREDSACRGREREIGIRPVRVSFELPDGYVFTGPIARVEKVLSNA